MFDNFYTPQQLINTYGYGCYCLNLGDRPLAGIMTGVYPGNFYNLKRSKNFFEPKGHFQTFFRKKFLFTIMSGQFHVDPEIMSP